MTTKVYRWERDGIGPFRGLEIPEKRKWETLALFTPMDQEASYALDVMMLENDNIDLKNIKNCLSAFFQPDMFYRMIGPLAIGYLLEKGFNLYEYEGTVIDMYGHAWINTKKPFKKRLYESKHITNP